MGSINRWRKGKDKQTLSSKVGKQVERSLPASTPQQPASLVVRNLRVEGGVDEAKFDDLAPDQGYVINPEGVAEGDVLVGSPDPDGAHPPTWTSTPQADLVVTDGDPPASSPTPVLTGGPRWIAVNWDSISNVDPVTYEIHLSASNGFTPSGSTLVGEIRGTLSFVRNEPDDTPLEYDTDYYVRLIAKDEDGAASAGAQVGPERLDPNLADDITAGSVTAEKLEAVLILATMIATATSGDRVELDTDGLRVYNGSNIVVNLPSDGSDPSFVGDITLKTIDSSDVSQQVKWINSDSMSEQIAEIEVGRTSDDRELDIRVRSTSGVAQAYFLARRGTAGNFTYVSVKQTDASHGNVTVSVNSGTPLTLLDEAGNSDWAVANRGFVPGDIKASAVVTIPSGWFPCNGAAISRTTYSALFAAITESKGTCTMTIASPCVVTRNSHGLAINDLVSFETTGALPTGLSAGANYWIITAGFGDNSFQISASPGGAAINTSGSQSGVHTLRWAPFGVSGTSDFILPDLRGRAPIGLYPTNTVFDNLGDAGGEADHTLTIAEMPAHDHGGATGNSNIQVDNNALANRALPAAGAASGFGNVHTHSISSQGGGGTHNNMPPYQIIRYLIKY